MGGLDLGHRVIVISNSVLVVEAAHDFEGLLERIQRIVGLRQDLVSHAQHVQNQGALLLVLELDGETERAVQVVEPALRVAANSLDTSHGQQSVGIFGLGLGHLRVMLPSLIEHPSILVQPGQSELNVGIVRGGLGQIFVSLDGFGIVLRNSGVVGKDQVPFLGGKLFGEVHRLARGLFGIAVISQFGVNLAQP